jgi:flagellar protein FlaG
MFQSSLDGVGKVTSPAVVTNTNLQDSGLKVVARTDQGSQAADHMNKDALTGAVKKLNDYVAPALQTIQFSIDQDSERIIVKVVDTATQKVLRQIPNEEVLAITKTLDKLQGLVIRQTA